MFGKHNILLYYNAGYILHSVVMNPKDTLDTSEKCGVIYKLQSEDCQQMGSSLAQRVERHEDDEVL